MQDATCAFYKLQETLAENPGILSEDEVIFLLIFNCIGLLQDKSKFGVWRCQLGSSSRSMCNVDSLHSSAKKERKKAMKNKIQYKEITVNECSNHPTIANRTERTCNFS